ncbi:hypothetical protein [Nocardiopsis ansamitocini]|nr:hypothetical protein [Nocardiopsis ansamitocini]
MTPAPVFSLAELEAMNHQEFKAIVSGNLGDEHEELWELLSGIKLYPRTRAVLVDLLQTIALHANTERVELDRLKAECLAEGPEARSRFFGARSDYESRKRRRNGFKRLVEARMQRLKTAKRNNHETHQARNHDRHRLGLCNLALAVHQHRDSMLEEGITPDKHDLVLWEALEKIEVEMGGRVISLAQAIEYGHWTD